MADAKYRFGDFVYIKKEKNDQLYRYGIVLCSKLVPKKAYDPEHYVYTILTAGHGSKVNSFELINKVEKIIFTWPKNPMLAIPQCNEHEAQVASEIIEKIETGREQVTSETARRLRVATAEYTPTVNDVQHLRTALLNIVAEITSSQRVET